MLKQTKKYIRELSGAITVAFALMGPLLIGGAGMALDYAHAYLVQQRLSQAIDAAALAAAASSTDADEIEQKVREFFEQNYPPEKLGATFDPEVVVTDNEVIVGGHAIYYTFFLRVIGIDDINVEAETTVHRDVRGLEVVLVLDNTGSMATNNNIASLKTATQNFINILFDHAQDEEDVKIGLVPYSNSVRVGRYGLGLTPAGSVYAGGTPFVTLPSGVTYTTSHSSTTNWYGCVVEHLASGYQSSASHVTNSKGQLWRYSSNWKGHGWDPSKTNNDPYPQDITDNYEGKWDIYAYGKIIAQNEKCSDYSGLATSRCTSCSTSGSNRDKCTTTYCYCWAEQLNNGCPYAAVQPLTSDRAALLLQVENDNAQTARGEPSEPDDMEPHGNTAGNVGMMWGYRMISPEAPFEEAESWDNPYWRKAIVMMTDGDNTIDSGSTGYSYYGPGSKNTMDVGKMNERFEEVCDALKEEGVIIYTVTFTSAIDDDTKEYYERCASSEDNYYDAPTTDELKAVFEEIARELSNIYIAH